MNFTCLLTYVEDTVTVTPYGDIDLSATTELRETLQATVRNDSVSRIVVDLAGVTFIDSTVLGVLIASHSAAGRRDATFCIINPGPMVTMVLKMTDVYDILVDSENCTTSDEAVSVGD